MDNSPWRRRVQNEGPQFVPVMILKKVKILKGT